MKGPEEGRSINVRLVVTSPEGMNSSTETEVDDECRVSFGDGLRISAAVGCWVEIAAIVEMIVELLFGLTESKVCLLWWTICVDD